MQKLRYRPLSDVAVEYDHPLLRQEPDNRVFARVDRIWSDERSAAHPCPSRVPVSGRFARSVALCSFHETVTESEVVRAASDIGCAVATLAEVVAFARVYPQEQLRGPILALGSYATDEVGEMLCPMLACEESAARVLVGTRLREPFSSRYRFLLVRATVPLARFSSF